MKTKFKRSIGLILAAFTGFSLFSCAGAGVQNSSSSGNKNLENEYIEEAVSTATARWMDGSEFTPVVRFAAAADTHLNEKYVVDSDRRVENLFTDAYKYARSQEYDKLDAVIFCGDVCERGKEKEYINLRNAWTKNSTTSAFGNTRATTRNPFASRNRSFTKTFTSQRARINKSA